MWKFELWDFTDHLFPLRTWPSSLGRKGIPVHDIRRLTNYCVPLPAQCRRLGHRDWTVDWVTAGPKTWNLLGYLRHHDSGSHISSPASPVMDETPSRSSPDPLHHCHSVTRTSVHFLLEHFLLLLFETYSLRTFYLGLTNLSSAEIPFWVKHLMESTLPIRNVVCISTWQTRQIDDVSLVIPNDSWQPYMTPFTRYK